MTFDPYTRYLEWRIAELERIVFQLTRLSCVATMRPPLTFAQWQAIDQASREALTGAASTPKGERT